MARSIIAFGLAAAAFGWASESAKAQIGIGFGGPRGGFHLSVGGRGPSGIAIRPSVPVRPSYPIHVGPTHVVNHNPWTGAVDTHNTQINNTAFTPGRDASRFNGTARHVNRPIYDGAGRVVAWERGTVWQNSHTGQWHGDTTVHRPNGTGGTSSTTVVRSAAPPASGTHSTRVAYSGR